MPFVLWSCTKGVSLAPGPAAASTASGLANSPSFAAGSAAAHGIDTSAETQRAAEVLDSNQEDVVMGAG